MERVNALPGRAEALDDSSGSHKELTNPLRRVRARLWPFAIGQYLALLFLIIAAPLSALAFLATEEVAKADRNASRAALMASTKALAAAIDKEISQYRLLAEQLGQSRSLLGGDLVDFWREAKSAAALLPGTSIVVVDPVGRTLVNTMSGDARVHVNTELEDKVILNKQPQLSDLFMGAATGRTIATITVPVFRDGIPAYVISIALDPARFQHLLEEQHFPEGWLTALLDRQGRFIARLPWGSADIGTEASEAWRAAIRRSPEGFAESRIAIEGYRLVSAYTQTDDGWTVGVAVRAGDLDAPLFSVQRRLALAAGSCLLLSGTLGWLTSRKLVRQTDRLLRAAKRLAQEKQIDWQSTGIREYDLVQSSFAETSAILRARNEERRRADEHRQLLLDELNHRVRNTLTAVLSIAMQTFRGKAEPEVAQALQARLMALSRAHDILTREHWDGADLSDIVKQATAPYRGDGGRIRFEGPSIRLLPKSALALAMAMHELCTNAVKYGALKGDQGRVSIEWQATNTAGAPRLRLRWEESGGPPVREPTKHGFGSRLLRSLSEDLDAQVELHYPSTGVVCTIEFRADEVIEQQFATCPNGGHQR
jgi:two-component sensor histidine kinase